MHISVYMFTTYTIIGYKYLQPPPLPSTHVKRHHLLHEIATKLLQATIDTNKYETTLTITGAGGFGKTTTVISLCHYPPIMEHFTDGFLLIELGPQATDPSIKLREIYHLLSGEQCGINVAQQKINQLTSNYYCNLLVIIDDVWYVEDAEPLVKVFSHCKTILTTRMSSINKYLPSSQSISIGPMEQSEAFCLLISGVVDSSQLSHEDVSLLDELAQDVHLWPLLLSLIRGQLSHNLKQYHLSYHNAIQNVQFKLRDKGITAFDKNNIKAINKSRNIAVKACIEMTLELLTKSLSDKIKSLILYTGIGPSIQIVVLSNVWKISQEDTEEIINTLWAYGLVQFTDITISPNNITQHCVKIHAIISQHIIECMDSNEVFALSPASGKFSTGATISAELALTFQQSYGIQDGSSLTVEDYLKYKLSEIDKSLLPFRLKNIYSFIIVDPHVVIIKLQNVKDALLSSPYTYNLLLLVDKEINTITNDCKQILKDIHRLSRELNQRLQRILFEKLYDELIQTVEEFIRNYPLCSVAQKAVTMVKKIMSYCDGELLYYIMRNCEDLQMLTCDYHRITTLVLPYIKLYIKQYKQITGSLVNGSPDIELTCHYFISGKNDEEGKFLWNNRLIKLQDVAPIYVQQLVSEQLNYDKGT